jgi:hypothetical protein
MVAANMEIQINVGMYLEEYSKYNVGLAYCHYQPKADLVR